MFVERNIVLTLRDWELIAIIISAVGLKLETKCISYQLCFASDLSN
jgi:hypothetical protein